MATVWMVRSGEGRSPIRHRISVGDPMNVFRELDTVELTHDVPDAGLRTGDLGPL